MSSFVRILLIVFLSFSLSLIYSQPSESNVPSQNNSKVNEYLQSICGQSDVESINDNKVADLKPGEYPWLVAIYETSKNGPRYFCAGSLISAKTVLTAAHCFVGSGLTAKHYVRLGSYNLSDIMNENVLERKIKSLVIHPDFKSGLGSSDADIALLEMAEPVSFTKFIRPICLWSEPSDLSLIVNKSGLVAGWGAKDSNASLSLIPSKVHQNVVSQKECVWSSPIFLKVTSERTLCAGSHDDVGPCLGGSGSGLIFNRNGRWILRAVVSTGITKGRNCAFSGYVVYCDIAQHLEWVLDSMWT